ncbi:MAG: ABC transporter ATP-binding protein [Solirubrobacterales bacterium]
MNRDIAIEVSGLGKRFEIGAESSVDLLLTEKITRRLKHLGRPTPTREFWALQDIDFEVKRGETLGVIGHNGAGKSTLLKILARITHPTVGEARLRGRVGALLEVGTGFHPELTGRENVFLNGAILSMKRAEIRSRFDEIVEFADIGPFIDTPVKRYSSGMQLRLAFSVAAHLEPEILIVDEVLSVGDMSFQRKCLGRMEEASKQGRTVVFISHNLGSVMALCNRAIMLSKGRIAESGPVQEVVNAYVADVSSAAERSLRERENREGTGELRFTDVRIERDGRMVDTPVTGVDHDIVLSYEIPDGKVGTANFGMNIVDPEAGARMLNFYSETTGVDFRDLPPTGEVRCSVKRWPLPAGQYSIDLWSDSAGVTFDLVRHAYAFTVAGGDFHGSGREPPADHRSVLVDHTWSVSPGGSAGEAEQRVPSATLP